MTIPSPLNLPDDDTWIEVAQTLNQFESEIIAGLLRTADIPVYIESNPMGLPSTFFGIGSPGRVYVPAQFYQLALDLLDSSDDLLDESDNDFPPALDEPSIRP
jgi:hypothetical protein